MASQRHHGSATVCPAGWRAAAGWSVGMASRCRWIGIPLRTQHQASGHPQFLVGKERQTHQPHGVPHQFIDASQFACAADICSSAIFF